MMVGIRSLERITSDLVCALPKKVSPAFYHLVPLRPIRYYICSQGGGGVKLCVYTLHTGGAKTTCRMYMYYNCPVWHTAGLFFIWTEAVRAFYDNAMIDSQLINKNINIIIIMNFISSIIYAFHWLYQKNNKISWSATWTAEALHRQW